MLIASVHGKVFVDRVRKFSLRPFEGDRLDKRCSTQADDDGTVLLEFEGIGKRFGLWLQPHDSILQAGSTLRIHKGEDEESEVVEEEPITGTAYVAKRVIVLDRPKTRKRYNMAAAMMKDANGDSEDAFAHFYIAPGNGGSVLIQGGFMHGGQFYQVNHQRHPRKPTLQKELVKSHAHMLAQDDGDELVVSVQPAGEMMAFGVERHANGTVARRFKCGHDLHPFNLQSTLFQVSNATMPSPQSNLRLQPRAHEMGCPTAKKTLLVGIVADCNYVKAFHGDRGRIQTSLINEFALVSGIYEKAFNINLGIMSIELMMGCAKERTSWNAVCEPKHLLTKQLSQFSRYRGEALRQDVGVYHLVTDCAHTEVVGIAWMDQVCKTRGTKSNEDWVSGTSASTLIKNHFAVIAHEIAHNLGAMHDCDEDACSRCSMNMRACECCPCGAGCDCGNKFIMNPGSGSLNVREFSPCTLSHVCGKMSILATCLVEPGKSKTLSLSQCGNGIREEGEECDCGTPEQCAKDPCCMEGCKLRAGADCADSNDLCCRQCKVIPASERFVCGKANGFCQTDSVCRGQRDCPPVKLHRDGTRCPDVTNGRCAAGLCTNRDTQCKLVGAHLGIRKACDTPLNGCQLVCAGPGGQCLTFDATYSDGVPCGTNGHCKDGECSELAVVTVVSRYWIGAVLVLGTFAAASFTCLLGSCQRRRPANP